MNRIVSVLLALFGIAIAAAVQNSPTLTIINQAQDPANVRVLGPTAGYLSISSGSSRTLNVSGGEYRLKIQYCDSRGNCHYSATDRFSVTQTSSAVSRITVTLHSTGGNLNERGISESEFNSAN
jgi:hypothetical protein